VGLQLASAPKTLKDNSKEFKVIVELPLSIKTSSGVATASSSKVFKNNSNDIITSILTNEIKQQHINNNRDKK